MSSVPASACIRYSDGYRYQLRAPYVIKLDEIKPEHGAGTDWLTLDTDGTLTIRAGYAWDGASGPTIDTRDSMRASLVHDSIYQLCRLGLLDHKFRAAADAIFYRICKEDGMLGPRAWLWYHMVRIFAKRATEAESEAPIESAGCGCP